MKILLASQSPRRKELLSQLGFSFECFSVDCDEVFPKDLPIEKVAGYLSELKANVFRSLAKDEILITADTIVALDEEVLGKPKDHSEAKIMLMKLSGRRHQVYTGVTLKTFEKEITITDVSNVEFDEITPSECDFYFEKCDVLDKAGSYGIQDWLGLAKIKKIEGSFYTIMGLPTHILYPLLKEFQNV